MTKSEQIKLGQAVIALFNLHVKPNGRVDTDGGDKTPLGLGATIERLVNEARCEERGPMYLEIYEPHPDGTKVMHLLGGVETLKLGHSLIPGSKLLDRTGREPRE